MAEFKLGRIKFVWKGDWTSSTVYYVDDVVRYGGRTYICVVGHTAASSFGTDLSYSPTRWNQFTDGQQWKGDWATSTEYKINDIVKYGGLLYACNQVHTSAATALLGLETDQGKWTLYAEGFDWKNDWAVSTRYKVNDLVKYGGITYLCNTYHTSAATASLGLEADQGKWTAFNQGLEYKGTWGSTTRYKVNDVVKYGSGLWICVTAHTSGGSFSSVNFTQFVDGFSYENSYNSGTTYKIGDIVRYGGNQYIAKAETTGTNPSTSTANWDLFSEGFSWQNDWDIATSYKIGDAVRQNGYSYVAVQDSLSISTSVTNTSSGSPYPFTCGSTTGMVAGMIVRFTGTTFGNVFTDGTYYIKQVIGGNSFSISVTPGGATFVPTTAAGTMTATVSAQPGNTTYWSRLNSGIFWKGVWTDDTEYAIGDAVKFGSNAYICVQNHRSEGDDGSTIGATGGGAANSRPDLDTNGAYWNALAVASEVEVLTTVGDLVYYSPSGPTRLPIGTEGQILRAGASVPEWATFGATEHVYFVATSGSDHPAPIHGKTRDKPWKTIRYACEQVEKGPRNPNAKHLLEMNRAFIQREVAEWIDYQVANTISPFSGSFDYDEYKCERDIGYTIDALIHDIGHGGNVKTRGVANALTGGITEDSPGAYPGLAVESDESIAAYNYMLTVIADVLNNNAPTVNYQVTNGDNSTSVVEQFIDNDYEAETTAITEITSLVTLVTDAIDAGVPDDIPVRNAPNNLIIVATGQYRETLPIIVPEQTCILGDELRSTNAGPAGSLVDISDSYYSITALSRLESVVGDIILGNNVTESSGNTETQDIAWPYASSVEEEDIEQLVRSMKHKIDFNLGTLHLSTTTDPTGYNGAYLSGYGDARRLLKENKTFIQEEIIAYLADTYPNLKYSRTSRKRDVGYIVDAMIYDLTYGGYTQSLNAGLAYFDGNSSTLMIDSTEITPVLDAYTRLKIVMQQIIANTSVVKSNTNTATQWTDNVNLTGGSSANSFIGANIDIIYNILAGDSTGSNPPTVTIVTVSGANTITTSSNHNLQAGDTITPLETANGLTANTTYFIKSVPAGDQMTIAASYDGSTIGSLSNGTGLSIPAHVVDWPAATNGVSSTTALITAYTTLSAAVGTIVTNTISYLTANYSSVTYNQSKCERDIRIILNAVGYDFMFNSNFQSIKAAYAYLRSSASEVFSLNQKAATRAALTYAKTQAKSNVGGNATAQSRIETLMTLIDDILFSASNEGTNCATGNRSADYAVLQLERNRNYILAEVDAYIGTTFTGTVTATSAATEYLTIGSTSWLVRNAAIRFSGSVIGGVQAGVTYYVQNVVSSTTFRIATTRNANTPFDLTVTASGSMTVSLYYDEILCARDTNSYIDAIKYDMKYPGNYKTLFAARLYSNAVKGSLEEDMYYLRDGTGIRDQTLDGLSGDLLPANEYGTSRVSAGAYCSLDPGWGPDDYRTWIINRSPYVQGVTTFGTAAIGQKIDGALHNGGNDSIVSNDFTQVISDGIGAWVANNGRAELVSVFSYYAHIGYLSTEGGRIRGTNGNNSYGDYGSVAEGFDATETPNTGIIDNKFQFDPVVGSILTDGDQLLAYEYEHAGNDFTEAVWTLTGAGLNGDVEQDEFRDDAVFQVRLLDLVEDSSNAPEADGNIGGFGYLSNANTAQTGTTTQITIAATDDESSSAYVGMKVYLTGGTGVGQFAIIDTYNSGTKVATVVKETTGAAGWDHIIPGTTIVAPDASSTYVIEPRLSFNNPGFAASSRTLPSSSTWVDATYGDIVSTYTGLSGTTSGTGTGATFNVVKRGNAYLISKVASGANYDRSDTITISGTSLGGASTTNDITITITAVNSVTGAIQAFDSEGQGAGGSFVAIASGTSDLAYSLNGTSWTGVTSGMPASTTWVSVAAGNITTVDTAGSFTISRSYTISTLGSTDYVLVGASANAVGINFVATGVGTGTGTARPNLSAVVAISSTGTISAYSRNGGLTWSSGGALPAGMSGTGVSVAYGDGRWVAIGSSGATAYSTNGGVSWTAGGALPAGTYTGVTYGAGKWVAVATGGTVAASSTNGGVNWTLRTLPSSSNWTSVTYGNNRFVAVSNSSGAVAAYSLNGTTWTASTLPATASWTSISYGQGVFLAVSQSTQAASSEDGVHWTSRTMSTAANGFSAAVFGNPNRSGIWAAVQRSTAGTVASSVLTGATTKARAVVTDEKISVIRITEPGSGYSTAPTMTITDSNNIYEAPFSVRKGDGVLGNPSFKNRGAAYSQAGAEIDSGDGYADFYQEGSFVAVRRLTQEPVAGSNVVFSNLPDRTFKLVNVVSRLGEFDGSYTAFFQISPSLTVSEAPEHGDSITTRIRYSQVRLTGHDFLDIGTGNFTESNYPGTPTQSPIPANETVENNGGRVFYTSTDQDGNFRVGGLFSIEQATGVATLNADAFNISGLQELTLGSVALGGASATINEFSTDPFFTADSDSVIPTQRAIKAYISAQIGGGGASLNVNSITAGSIKIDSNQITNVSGTAIKMRAHFEFQGSVSGYPVAWNYFLV